MSQSALEETNEKQQEKILVRVSYIKSQALLLSSSAQIPQQQGGAFEYKSTDITCIYYSSDLHSLRPKKSLSKRTLCSRSQMGALLLILGHHRRSSTFTVRTRTCFGGICPLLGTHTCVTPLLSLEYSSPYRMLSK